MTFDQQIAFRPLAANRCGAYCMICNRPADSEEIKEGIDEKGNPDRPYCRVLVRCHGTEELRTFPFGTIYWTLKDDLARAMQRCAWFDPLSHQETAGIPNNGIINDEDDTA